MPTIQIADKPTLDTVASNVSSVKSSIENANYGLSAIKTAIDNSGGGNSLTFPRVLSNGGGSAGYNSTNTLLYVASEKCYIRVYFTVNTSRGYNLTFKTKTSSGDILSIYIFGANSYITPQPYLYYRYIEGSTSSGYIVLLLEKNESLYVSNDSNYATQTVYYQAYTYEPAQ